MTAVEQLFLKHRNLIRKRAWVYAQTYKVEFEELEAQGYLIFLESLDKFDDTKAAFGTFLYWKLNGLQDFCYAKLKYQAPLASESFDDEDSESTPSRQQLKLQELAETSYALFLERLELAAAIMSLSSDACELLTWLKDGHWRKPSYLRKTPSLSYAIDCWREKGWGLSRVENAWTELANWWRREIEFNPALV